MMTLVADDSWLLNAPKDARMRSRTIEPIQQLRAVAALGVVLFHSISQIYGSETNAAYARLGSAGVDLFFVISGFIMWVTAINRDQAPAQFAVNRVVRIVPLYWLITTFVLLVVVVAPSLMRSAAFDPMHTAASYGFVAWPHPKFENRFWPLVVPGWTLNYEMEFYAIVMASLFFKKQLRFWLITGSLVVCVALGYVFRPVSILEFYTNPILIEFLFGVTIGALYTRAATLRPLTAYVILALAAATFLTIGPRATDFNRTITWGMPMAMLLFGAVNLKTLFPGSILKKLGDASYSIYLTQFCSIAPSAKFLAAGANSSSGKILALSALMLIATGVGVALYYVVEKPVTERLRQAIKSGACNHVYPVDRVV